MSNIVKFPKQDVRVAFANECVRLKICLIPQKKPVLKLISGGKNG